MTDNIIREIRVIRENPRFRRYPEYKESGVEWIGEIPAHWEINRLKYVAKILPSNVDKHIYPDEIQVRLCNYTDVYYNDYITVDTVLKKGSCKEGEFAKFVLRKGNVIITKDSETPDDIGVPTFVKDDLNNVVCGYHLTMIRPLACRGEFIFRFIQSDRMRKYFELESNGVTRYGLGKSSIENLLLPIPTDSEQRQIANFLDRKTEQIDELIRIKERRIELLQEQRTALINQAVTKGLDPNVEMKLSGVEWIGEIPSHWKIKCLKYITDLNMGQSPPSEEYNTDQIGTPFLQGNAEFGMRHPTPKIYCPTARKHANSGDILLSVRAPVGAINVADQEYGIGRGLCAIRSRSNQLELRYAKYLVEVVRTELHVVATGSTYDAVAVDDVSNVTCVVPPLSEQAQISKFIDRKTEQIDDLIAAEHRKIQLLQEYRQSLISEAVTGKIDVRSKV